MVDHVAHIRFVDAHAECVGGHDHRHTVGHEVTLRPLTHVRGHAAMIGDRDGTRLPRIGTVRRAQFRHGMVERGRERLRFLACRAVDDAGFVGMFGNVFCHPEGFMPGFQLDDVEIQVRSVEAGDGHIRVAQSQHGDDVVTYTFRCGRGECGYGRTCRQVCDEFADAEVGRAEILSPLGYAVCLIDGDQ